MNEDFRKTAPAPLAPQPFNIPQPFETCLPNGLKVVIFENNNLPIISYRLAFRSGQINDPQDSRGLSSATASLLTEGTTSRSSKQLAEEIERIGAALNASSSSDNTVISASALSMYNSEVLRLMADVVLNPAFPENELALYKQNAIEGLKVQRSNPSFLANERISKILFGAHPYAIVSPTAADIEKISRDNLIDFHQQKFIPNNAMLIVVGDVKTESLLTEVTELFGSWQKGNVVQNEFPAPPSRTETTLTIVDRTGSAQSNIILANPAIKRQHPDFFPLLVMNQILGAGASSRLFMNLREEKGYTYGAYSSLDARRQAGAFEATAEVRTQVTGDSLKEFFYELNRIRDEQATEKELQDAQNYLTGVFPIRAETQEGLTNLIVSQQLYDLPADYLQTYREKVSAVTIDEVQRVAQTYVTPDKMAIAIVGDADEILSQVKKYAAKIDAFNADGDAVDISSYGKPKAAPAVDVTGNWSLNLELQGQKIPISFKLRQDGEKVSGSVESMLGEGEISSGKVSGNTLVSTATMQIQGQEVELNLNGTVDDDSMVGTISASIPGFPPVNFEGKRNS